jgi:hypothetical protein
VVGPVDLGSAPEVRADTLAWIHRSISELDSVSRGQQAIWDGIALHLMGAGLQRRKRAFDQRYRIISYVGFDGSRLRPTVVSVKTTREDPMAMTLLGYRAMMAELRRDALRREAAAARKVRAARAARRQRGV